MTTLIIPMAGNGSRFAAAGYKTPKPFLPVNGRPMIEAVIEETCAAFPDITQVVLVAKADHVAHLSRCTISRPVSVVLIDKTTEGAACTVLLGTKDLSPDEPLVVANSDQTFAADADNLKTLREVAPKSGIVLTFDGEFHKKWSYHCKHKSKARVVEKPDAKPEGDVRPTCGIYYFPSVQDFRNAVGEMIRLNDRVNNEFYLAPVFNYLPTETLRFNVNRFAGLGTPEDYETFFVGGDK